MALSIQEFMARWFKSVGDFRGNEIAMAQMKADLEEIIENAMAIGFDLRANFKEDKAKEDK